MKVFVMGSIGRNENEVALVASHFKSLGCEVRYICKQPKPFVELPQEAFMNIDNWADLIVVVPQSLNPTLVIGDGLHYELEYAKKCGKMVLMYTNI